MVRVIFLCGLLFLAAIRPAYAYIDPGTASIALQALIGAIAVGGFYFRSTIAKVLRLLRPGRHGSDRGAQQLPAESVDKNTDDG